MNESVVVRHNVMAGRYEAVVGELLCHCDYEIQGDRVVFTHTFVPPELRGRGIAERLLRAALAEVRASGKKIVPACSYVEVFIQRHGEYQDLLTS